jgi:hypothetical protein
MVGAGRPERAWRKSIRSASQSNCVEVARGGSSVLVRDSKDPGGPKLAVGPRGWREFVRRARDSGFDLR